MLNFSNLNDVEFEYLCKDVMSKMLRRRLQRFGTGRDGGIDLTDDVWDKSIIVQVKHYVKTDISGLLTSLKKEIPKVKANNPKKYYVCCSKELTPKNKLEIYTMFSEYMESPENIISIIEISDFLDRPENADILHKHFKLWIESTNVLSDIFSKDICIDSEVLLSDINESLQMFVKTSAYDCAISCLEKCNVLIIVGNPGVGKTITSQMLVLHYVNLGYRVRYTSDGADLASLKKALSISPETKEVILLDDCFGQAYFSMKETQENELLTLIKYVKSNSNKILIMNSRVTIYQEATERTPQLQKSLDKKEYKAFILDISEISHIEKAKILYNHLFFCGVPQEYLDDIKKEKQYLKIVKHKNYNPRIVEFVTNQRQFEFVNPSEYSKFVIRCLDYPEQIWENEYNRRLVNTDRILLNTLYSLTNTTISLDIVRKCYMHRIGSMQGVDSSVNHFEQALKRLQNSMIKIVDYANKKMLSVANPSVNDFLSEHLKKNIPERNAIVSNSMSVRQLKRMLSAEEYEIKLKQIFEDKTILEYEFDTDSQKEGFIVYYCAVNNILDEAYKKYFIGYILHLRYIDIFEVQKVSISYMNKKLWDEKICSFYELDKIICDTPQLIKMLSNLELKEVVGVIKRIDHLFEGDQREDYVKICEDILKEAVDCFGADVQVDEYDIDVGKIIDDCGYEDGYTRHIDGDVVASEIDAIVEDLAIDEINECLSDLPKDIVIDQEFVNRLSISVSGSSELVESFLCDDFEDYYYEQYREREFDDPEIEYIFER